MYNFTLEVTKLKFRCQSPINLILKNVVWIWTTQIQSQKCAFNFLTLKPYVIHCIVNIKQLFLLHNAVLSSFHVNFKPTSRLIMKPNFLRSEGSHGRLTVQPLGTQLYSAPSAPRVLSSYSLLTVDCLLLYPNPLILVFSPGIWDLCGVVLCRGGGIVRF